MRVPPQWQPNAPRIVYVRRRRRKPHRFRWHWVVIPLGIAVSMWFLSHIRFSIDFESVMDLLGVVHRERYRQLAMLCILGIAACLLVRLWRKPPKDGED